MIEALTMLLALAKEGRLNVESLRIGTHGYELEVGNTGENFEGEIKLRVTMDTDVLSFGSMLSECVRRENENN
jgi:hypothetical protein